MDQIGVMSKRVKDSAEVLNVIAGPDEHDATVSEKEVPDYTSFLGQDVKGLRVAVPKEYMDAVDGEMREVIQKQIDVLKDAGAIINEVSLPHTKYVVPTYYIVASSEASSNLQRYDGIRYGYRAKDTKNLLDVYVKSRSEGFGDEVKRRIMLGSFSYTRSWCSVLGLSNEKYYLWNHVDEEIFCIFVPWNGLINGIDVFPWTSFFRIL